MQMEVWYPITSDIIADNLLEVKPRDLVCEVWSLNTSLGYLVQFQSYKRAWKVSDVHSVGMEWSVDLIYEIPANKSYHFYLLTYSLALFLCMNWAKEVLKLWKYIHTNYTTDCPLTNINYSKTE